jgi:hypothetical protein
MSPVSCGRQLSAVTREPSAVSRVPQPSAFCAEAGELIVHFCLWTRAVSLTSPASANYAEGWATHESLLRRGRVPRSSSAWAGIFITFTIPLRRSRMQDSYQGVANGSRCRQSMIRIRASL